MKQKGLKRTMLVTTVILSMIPSMAFAADSLTGAAAAASDSEYTLQEMLTYAMEDEMAAQNEYNAILDTFGTIRPFSNIVKAEQTHIDILLPLLQEYGVEVPESVGEAQIAVPDSIADANLIGAVAEKQNIAMYESFLAEDIPDDVRLAFEELSSASEKHLFAFENTGNGLGQGERNGTGLGQGEHDGTGLGHGAGNGYGNGRGNGGSGK